MYVKVVRFYHGKVFSFLIIETHIKLLKTFCIKLIYLYCTLDFYDSVVPTVYNLILGKIVIDVSNRNSVHSKMDM